jgi:hypothetical protein
MIGGIGSPSAYAYTPPTGASAAGSGATPAADGGAKADFLKWAQMTPAERMRANILSSMGLSEEDVQAMSPKDREKVEAKVKEMIEEKLTHGDKKPGQLVDVTA